MLNCPQGFGADFQFENFAQSVAQQRNNLKIGQKTTAVFIVSMADIVAAHNAGARNITFFSHCKIPYKKYSCLLILIKTV